MPAASRREAHKRPAKQRASRERLAVEQRKAQLLELGLAMFSAQAYDAVSIDEVAREAGISKGLLYHYFPTKRDFYVAALELAAAKLLVQTTPSDDGASPTEQVTRGLEAYLDFVAKHAGAYLALMRGGIGSDPVVAEIVEATRATFVHRLREAMPPELGAPIFEVVLRGWLGFVEAITLDWLANRTVGRRDVVRLASGVLFGALHVAREL
jgi:AcrR family transcriptional regulator